MIEVQWDLLIDDSVIADKQTTLLRPWFAISENGSDAAREIVEDYFRHDPEVWTEWFGEDDGAALRLVIHNPLSIAGAYTVEAEKVITARCRLEETK